MNDCSLIAFKDIKENYWITNYKITYGQNELIVQAQYYEKMLDILNDEIAPNDTIYTFCKSEELIPANTNVKEYYYSNADRCDYNKYGPTSFYPAPVNKNIGKVIAYRSMLAVTGTAHLVRLDVETISNIREDTKNQQSVYQSARTLSGAIKLIDEWRQVQKEPWNNTELIAVKAGEFLQKLDLPEEIMEDFLAGEPDKRLFSYLKQDPDLNRLLESNDFISNSFKTYIKDRFRYKSIKNLRVNHSYGQMIEEAFEQKETHDLEEMLKYYCVINGLNFNQISYQDIADHAFAMENYVDGNNTITDAVRKLTD
jgi:hypothetical protein